MILIAFKFQHTPKSKGILFSSSSLSEAESESLSYDNSLSNTVLGYKMHFHTRMFSDISDDIIKKFVQSVKLPIV